MKEKSGERSLGLIANPENKFNLKFLLWNDQRGPGEEEPEMPEDLQQASDLTSSVLKRPATVKVSLFGGL